MKSIVGRARQGIRHGLRYAAVAVVGLTALVPQAVSACPFCTAVSQTLRQEMSTMDAVVIAEATADSKRDETTGEVPLRVIKVLKGQDYIAEGAIVQSVYYGSVEVGRRFMLSGVEPKALMWSSPLPVDQKAEEYLVKVMALPEDDLTRLQFYMNYLQDESTMLARDAYDEFAITPYPVIQQLKDQMDHEQIVEWIKDPEMPADRRRLYMVMLGVCGTEADVPMLESMLKSTQPSARTGLDSLIACYVTLGGTDALPLINELFLANKQAPYADTYAAIMALRFHGSDTDIVPRSELVKSLHNVLQRPDLADLVIPDLARWGDWTQIDRLVTLFEQADADNNWIRVPVVNYMRACPLPEAKAAMEKLKTIDPEAVKRANTFFTAPVPPPDTGSSTSSLDNNDAVNQVGLSTPSTPQLGAVVADARPVTATPAAIFSSAPVAAGELPNPFRLFGVMVTAVSTLLIIGYLLISGGAQPQPQVVPVRTSRQRSGR